MIKRLWLAAASCRRTLTRRFEWVLHWVTARAAAVVESLRLRTHISRIASTLRPLVAFAPAALVLTGVLFVESRTSWIESALFSAVASRLSYSVEPGPSDAMVPPRRGPLDARRGYADLVDLQNRLVASGFRVREQSRFSPGLATLARWGISPPQGEPATAGLVIEDEGGRVLYDATATQYRFRRYKDIPPVVARSLLYIENRRLDRGRGPNSNPAVDWGRLSRAAVLSFAHRLGMPTTFQGGSTLAVQLEKFQHSDEGRTGSVVDKMRQIVSASLAAYKDGPDTRGQQRKIVLDYLNGVPLAAAPRYGEVHGIGNGLRVWLDRTPDRTFAALDDPNPGVRARAFKAVLAMICAIRAPSHYLITDRASLERRVDFYAVQLANAGIVDADVARRAIDSPLRFADEVETPQVTFDERKPVNLVRNELVRMLGLHDYYELDGTHLEVQTSLDKALQDSVATLFQNLKDPEYLASHGLIGPRLLGGGDPAHVVYTIRLLEHGPDGEHVIVHTDNQDRPFDYNDGTRLELGSTAKLRTLVHYLELVSLLYGEMHDQPSDSLWRRAQTARDPITAWAAAQLARDTTTTLDSLLSGALDRRYSASPGEVFFTGGGAHVFHNFDPDENGSIFTVREGIVHSNNLVMIRLMRDIVRYHAARLPYDATSALENTGDPERMLMLDEIADEEALHALHQSWDAFHGAEPGQLVSLISGPEGPTPRQLTALYYAWHHVTSVDSLRGWLRRYDGEQAAEHAEELAQPYTNARFGIEDYGYLAGRHPIEVWCAGELFNQPDLSWDDLQARSLEARRVASEWLFRTRNHRAQALRLRTRIERDAFARMTPYWQRLGFPFRHLVPSYATAIGSSADRPDALADLMGIIVNDGVRRPATIVRQVRLAPGTPYHTVLVAAPTQEQQLIEPAVAQAVKGVLQAVVERGTARRAYDAFRDPLGRPVEVGGKTGSGDNRIKVFAKGGRLIESKPVSRSAAFTFFIGDRHYGVITASVTGPESGQFQFTSSLPLAILTLLAPSLDTRLGS